MAMIQNGNFQRIVDEYIKKQAYMTPLFNEDVYDFVVAKSCGANKEDIKFAVNMALCRIEKQRNDFIRFQKGVYYKAENTVFGYAKLDPFAVARKKYIQNTSGIIGYETGYSLFAKAGLTTQIPKDCYIATNRFTGRGQFTDAILNTVIIKPVLEVTENNYKYLQALELILNRLNVNVEVENRDIFIYDFIEKQKLDSARLMYYAGELGDKNLNNTLIKIYHDGVQYGIA
jgi:hypothetical protein